MARVVSAKPPGQLNSLTEELTKDLQAVKETEDSLPGQSAWISFKGGRISVDDAPVPDNTLDVVVLDYILENQFYPEAYDPNNPSSPVCFAFGRTADNLKPHEDSEEAQHEACKGCAKNAWGSATIGRGKACKEVRRLAVITAEDAINDPLGAEVRLIKVPVTSCKNWSGFVRHVGDVLQLPPYGVVTRITTEGSTPFTILFKVAEKLPEAALPGILQKRKLVEGELFTPYTPIEVVTKPQPPARGARKFSK